MTDTLLAALTADVPPFYRVAELGKKEARIVAVLMAIDGPASKAAVCDALGMSESVFWAHISHIRFKLEPHGVRIETLIGIGVQISEADKARLRALPPIPKKSICDRGDTTWLYRYYSGERVEDIARSIHRSAKTIPSRIRYARLPVRPPEYHATRNEWLARPDIAALREKYKPRRATNAAA